MGRSVIFLLLGTAGTVLLQLAGGQMGSWAVLLNLLVPMPAAFVHMCFGPMVGGAIVVISAVCFAVLGSASDAAMYFVQFGLASFALPFLLRRKMSWDGAAALSTGIVLFAVAILAGSYASDAGVTVPELVTQHVKADFDRALQEYQQANLPMGQLAQIQAMIAQMVTFISSTYPALAIVYIGFIQLLIVFYLSVAARGRYELPGCDFADWRSQDPLIWFLIAGGFGAIFGTGTIYSISLNVLVVVLPVYFIQGIAIATHYFRKKGISPIFRSLGYVLMFFVNPFPIIMTAIGVFDLWVDFRKPRAKKT